MDSVFIEGLSLKGKHGVGDDERRVEQEFLLDIRASFDSRNAARTDKLSDTVDYMRFKEIAAEVIERNSFYLIEKLAEAIAQEILEDSRIESVCVTVRKSAVMPPALPGVTVLRKRT